MTHRNPPWYIKAVSDLSAEASRGARANAVLQNDVYRDAYSAVRQAIFDKWEACPVRDAEGQHELKIMLKLLRDVDRYMTEAVNSGKIARIQMEHENTLKARVRKIFRAA